MPSSDPTTGGEQRERCPRDSDWCDGAICRDFGVDCPNADPPRPTERDGLDAWKAYITFIESRCSDLERFAADQIARAVELAERTPPVPAEVDDRALRMAIDHGRAIGLREAAQLLRDAAQERGEG